MAAQINLDPALDEIAGTYERLAAVPPPSLDLTQETRALDSLLAAGHVLTRLEPSLIPLVCHMVLRELGRFPESRREELMFATLAITPPEDETILRIMVERLPPIKTVMWLLAHPEPTREATVKRLERFFRCVPPHALNELLDGLIDVDGTPREIVMQGLRVVETRIAHLLRPACEHALGPEAARLIRKLALVGDRAVAPLVSQLVRRLEQSEAALMETAITILAATGDRAFVASVEPYLDHADAAVRMTAATALGTLGGTVACEHLERAIRLKNLDLDERKAMLEALASIDSEDARQRLRKFARSSLFGGFPEPLRTHAAALLEARNAKNGRPAHA